MKKLNSKKKSEQDFDKVCEKDSVLFLNEGTEERVNLGEELKLHNDLTKEPSNSLSEDLEDEELILESDIRAEADELILDEKSIKTYWTDETEDGIVEFLYLNEFFYENRIKEEHEDAVKEKRPVNKSYCRDMEMKMEAVLQIQDRYSQREKIFRQKSTI